METIALPYDILALAVPTLTTIVAVVARVTGHQRMTRALMAGIVVQTVNLALTHPGGMGPIPAGEPIGEVLTVVVALLLAAHLVELKCDEADPRVRVYETALAVAAGLAIAATLSWPVWFWILPSTLVTTASLAMVLELVLRTTVEGLREKVTLALFLVATGTGAGDSLSGHRGWACMVVSATAYGAAATVRTHWPRPRPATSETDWTLPPRVTPGTIQHSVLTGNRQ